MLGYAGTVSTACQEIHELPRTFLSKDDAKKQKKELYLFTVKTKIYAARGCIYRFSNLLP
jgi:hypothetical protein